MTSNRYPIRTEKSLTVAAFLGGLILGPLTFILDLKIEDPPFETLSFSIVTITYKDLLILFSGIAAATLISSVYGLKTVLVHGKSEHKFFSRFALWSYEAGYLAILVLVPLLVWPFSMFSAIVILIIELLWVPIWITDKLKSRKNLEENEMY
jgi:hypothetical protein